MGLRPATNDENGLFSWEWERLGEGPRSLLTSVPLSDLQWGTPHLPNPPPRGGRESITYLSVLILLATASACAPAEQSGTGSQPSSGQTTTAPKTLTIGIQREPTAFNTDLIPGVTSAGGASQVALMVHDYLVSEDGASDLLPHLAERVISLDDGSWRINADGAMDTTWRLRPNVRWHDDAPFTAEDLVFSFA